MVAIAAWQFQWFEYLREFFIIKEIHIEGGERVKPDEVRGLIGIVVGDSIFVDLSDARSLLESLPQVRSVEIKRGLNRIIIRIKERIPFAPLLFEGSLFWIDEEGYLLGEIEEEGEEIKGPFISGVEVIPTPQGKRIKNHLTIEAIALFFRDIKAETFEEIRFKEGLPGEVVLYSKDFFAILSLENFKEGLKLLKEVLEKIEVGRYKYIDLRFEDEVILMPH